MENGQSPSKANKGIHRFISGRFCAVLAAPILLSILVFNRFKKKKTSAERQSTKGASAPLLISSIPAGGSSNRYDVFLSFRGSDTCEGFTDDLYNRLVDAGAVPICVFRDDNSIPISKEFDLQLLDVIARSKISIPIISKNYASSDWCLRELIHIMDCKKSMSHIVLPIFYKMDALDMQYLKGNFGNAFLSRRRYFDEKEIHKGQQALTEVSYLNGWESEKIATRHEGELIELVVKTILSELGKDFQLHVPEQLVGPDGHLKENMNWIESPSINARMIGMYGMGGIGKMTHIECIYNQLLNKFVHVSFLPDFQETTQHHGYLGSQPILDKLQSKNRVSKVDGISLIKSRFKGKKLCILLDDIDHKDQLNALVGERNWFMPRRMIIVTTRYEAALDQHEFGVDYRYGLNEMDMVQSSLFINKGAFRMDHSSREFKCISRDIISPMDVLLLAIEVVGSCFHGKTDGEVWKDMLNQFKTQPYRDFQKKSKISYDALEDGHEESFLNIDCLCVGKERKFVIYLRDDCGLYASQGTEELKLRWFIKIGDDGTLRIHDQQRDHGRNAVYHEGLLEKPKRPWDCNQAFEVLMGEKLSCNQITEHRIEWSSLMVTKRLKVLNLTLCKNLRNTLDLSDFTVLETLILKDCYGLEQVHPSIGKVKSLVSLDLSNCGSLRKLPEEVGKLEKLKELVLDFAGITEIPMSISSMNKLEKLSTRGCWLLREIPHSIWDLRNLQLLDISESFIEKIPSAIGRLKKLQRLSLQKCCRLKGEIPSEIGDLSLLEILEISGAGLSYLPESIQNLSSLQHLSLRGCYKLLSLPELPSSLTYLKVSCHSPRLPQLSCLIHLEELDLYECSQLEYIPELSQLNRLKRLHIEVCYNLVEIHGHDNLEFLEEIVIDQCKSIESLTLQKLFCLKKLKVDSCDNLVEIRGLDRVKFLEVLYLSNCRSIERLHDLSCFATLKELNIMGCKSLEKLPNLSKFENLENFSIRYSLGATEIPGVEELRSLTHIDITGCELIETLPDLSGCEKLQCLVVRDCKKLTQLPGLQKLGLIYLDISGCDSLESIAELPETHVFRNYERAQ